MDPDSAPTSSTQLDALAAKAHQELAVQELRTQALLHSRQATRRLRFFGTGGLVLAAALLAGYVQSKAFSPTPEQLEQGRMAAVRLISSSLAEHLRTHGSYPDRLEDALPLSSDFNASYRRTSNGYEIDLRDRNGNLFTLRHG